MWRGGPVYWFNRAAHAIGLAWISERYPLLSAGLAWVLLSLTFAVGYYVDYAVIRLPLGVALVLSAAALIAYAPVSSAFTRKEHLAGYLFAGAVVYAVTVLVAYTGASRPLLVALVNPFAGALAAALIAAGDLVDRRGDRGQSSGPSSSEVGV